MNLKDLNTPEKVMEFMGNIDYGWIGTDNKIRTNTIKGIQKFYRTQSPNELLTTRYGICIDDVELERLLLSPYYHTKSFAIISSIIFHSFLLLEKNGVYTYFEYSSYKNRGINHFLTEEEALEHALKSFMKSHNIKNRNKLFLVEYPTIPPNTTFEEMKNILTKRPNLLDKNNKDMKTY